jgi:cytochrome c553
MSIHKALVLAAGLGLATASGAATLDSTPAVRAVADVADGAQAFAAQCAQCHGRNARGMASFPSLRGRSADYLSARLHSYRAREMVGGNSMLMFPVAGMLSDQEIAVLAEYISTQFR